MAAGFSQVKRGSGRRFGSQLSTRLPGSCVLGTIGALGLAKDLAAEPAA